tara:strand:+ start:50 stop:577 length:528 start_codon:yes stop_codon:yes gene_type:complete
MKISKLIQAKTEREYFFLAGHTSLDSKYFIKKIEEGIKEQTNRSYSTHLMSKMTSFNYFIGDKKFLKILLPIFDLLDATSFESTPGWRMTEAWGYKQSFEEYSRLHHHIPCFLSGAIMLNEHPQALIFPEINETIEAKPGNFVVFSSFIKHRSNRNVTDKVRYGLSYNLYYESSF